MPQPPPPVATSTQQHLYTESASHPAANTCVQRCLRVDRVYCKWCLLLQIGYTVVMEPTAALRAVMSQGRKVKLLYTGVLLPILRDYLEPLIIPLALHATYRLILGDSRRMMANLNNFPLLWYCLTRVNFALIKMEWM